MLGQWIWGIGMLRMWTISDINGGMGREAATAAEARQMFGLKHGIELGSAASAARATTLRSAFEGDEGALSRIASEGS
jgi:hypothetical protein